MLNFVEDGIKVNQHVYLDVLKFRVLPWINSLPENQAVTQQIGQPLIQPKWFKPGARTTLSPFGQRNSGSLLLLILIRWLWDMVHLGEKGLRCVTFKCGKIEEEIERILGENRKRNYSCHV